MPFTSDPQSVADLLPLPDPDDVRAFLLAYLSVPANQITDWNTGAVLFTMWQIESSIICDLVGRSLVGLVENGYPNTASGESLKKLGHGWFGVDKEPAAAATQNVLLACDASHGPYTSAQVAALVAVASDGARYLLTSGAGALSSGGTLAVVFTAESPGAARGLISSLVAAMPGVTISSVSIATFGSDGDTDVALAAAIDARFDNFEIPVQDRVIIWALAAAPPPLITRWRRDADSTYPGGVLVTLANAGGPVAGGTVTLVNDAFDDLSPITDVNTAQNSTTHTIDASGIVTVKTALAPRAKAQADAAWLAATSGAQIGGLFFLQTLREIVAAAIKADPGSNFTDAALAGAGADGNVVLSSSEVPVQGGTLTDQLTWVLT